MATMTTGPVPLRLMTTDDDASPPAPLLKREGSTAGAGDAANTDRTGAAGRDTKRRRARSALVEAMTDALICGFLLGLLFGGVAVQLWHLCR